MKKHILVSVTFLVLGSFTATAHAAKRHKKKISPPEEVMAPVNSELPKAPLVSPEADIARDKTAFYGGLLFGAASPGGGGLSKLSTRFTWGANAGIRLPRELNHFGVGLYYFTSTQDIPGVNPIGSPIQIGTPISFYGVEGNYYFSHQGAYEGQSGQSWCRHLRAGLRLGLSNVSLNVGNVSGGTTPISFGPMVGYDFPIWKDLTLGGELNEMFLAGSNSAFQSPAFHVTNLLISAKYWF